MESGVGLCYVKKKIPLPPSKTQSFSLPISIQLDLLAGLLSVQ